MVSKEDSERLERLMNTIEDRLEAFEGHITHMKNKLEILKNKHVNISQ